MAETLAQRVSAGMRKLVWDVYRNAIWEARARDLGYLEMTGTDPDIPLRSCC